jgi:hypothetical protein
VGGQAPFFQRRDMGGGAIARITLPSISGVAGGEEAEEAIPDHLGQDARAGHRVALRVGIHYGEMLETQMLHWQAINQKQVVGAPESRGRAANGECGGPRDVESLNLADARGAEGKSGGSLPDQRSESLTLRRRQCFRVGNPGDGTGAGGHDDHTCDNGAREGAPSDFVCPGYELKPFKPERLLDVRPARYSPASGVPVSGTRTLFSLMRAPLPASPRR